jgi:DNA-binding IclR family transcriptional regulator
VVATIDGGVAVTVSTNIGRRLELLACLLEHEATTGRGMGVVSVGGRVGREKSQVSRGLAALAREGLIERDGETLEFSIGPMLLALAARAGSPELATRCLPVLGALAAELGELAELAVRFDTQVLTVESVAASNTVQSVGWTGRRTPLHCTAAGRVLLGGLADSQVIELIGDHPLPVAGPNAPGDVDELLRRIACARDDGWAVADRELDPDVVAIAAPVTARDGSVRAAVTVACPIFRVGDRLVEITAAVRRAATQLSSAFDSGD